MYYLSELIYRGTEDLPDAQSDGTIRNMQAVRQHNRKKKKNRNETLQTRNSQFALILMAHIGD